MKHRRNFKRVSIYGSAGVILIAVFGLLGYVPGLGLLGSVREGYIPMAPSTAISFILLGGILLAMTLRSLSGASFILFGVMAALVSLFGTLEVAGHFTARDLNLEDVLVPSAGYLGEIPIARMSPATGAAFLLAGLAVLALVLRRSRVHGRGTRLGHLAGSLGSLVLGIGLLFCVAYISGSPLLYGQGATVPMALTTALAFLMLGVATVGVSGEDAIPVSLWITTNIEGKPISARKRFLFLVLIMVGACAIAMTIMTVVLHRHEIQKQRQMMQAIAQSQARLIESIARQEARKAKNIYDENQDYDPFQEVINQIADAHERYRGFGKTGEFTLARREGDSIAFLLRHRHGGVEHPPPVAFDSDLAEPMRRALEGFSGTVIGLDYRGETVLAAHEPVSMLNLGIVAKIDLSEIRAPYIRSGLAAAIVAFLVILAGTALFFKVGIPIINRLEAYSRDLEKEITDRKHAEAEREESIAKLEAQNDELDRFTYTVSHDLKSPLITVNGFVGMLREDLAKGASAEVENDLARISSAVNKMERLLNDLLDLSRIGRLVNPPHKVPLRELAEKALELSHGRIEQRGVKVEIAPHLPVLYGDRVRLLEVLQNLIDNAVKYMGDQSQPRIEIGSRRDDGETVCYVRDNGIGIEPNIRDEVFGLFRQLNPKAEGSGIGLAVAKRIVEVHGGRIWVESPGAGQGSTFCFTLPAE